MNLQPQRTPATRRSIVAGTIGNLVEWFDWNVYAFLSVIIASQFFPKSDKVAGIIAALVIFGIGFLFRPLGGAALGSYADRHGRKAGMTLTILLMAGGSFAIALIPNYHAIGVAAPILLFVARAVQGFSAGGEFGTSSAYLVENATPATRATIGSWQQVSVGGGTLLAAITATLLQQLLPQPFLSVYGWRIAFILGGVLGLVGLWLRLSADETVEYTGVQRVGKVQQRPLVLALKDHPVATLRVIGMVAAGTALVQFWYAAYPSFLTSRFGLPPAQGGKAAIIGLAIFTLLVPFMGRLSDRVGRRPVLLFFTIASAASFAPMLLTMKPTMPGIILPMALSSVFLAAYAGSLAAMMAEQFPPEVRTAGISVPYGIAVAIFGGLTPVLANAMAGDSKLPVFVGVMTGLALLSGIVFTTMKETASRNVPSGVRVTAR